MLIAHVSVNKNASQTNILIMLSENTNFPFVICTANRIQVNNVNTNSQVPTMQEGPLKYLSALRAFPS